MGGGFLRLKAMKNAQKITPLMTEQYGRTDWVAEINADDFKKFKRLVKNILDTCTDQRNRHCIETSANFYGALSNRLSEIEEIKETLTHLFFINSTTGCSTYEERVI